MQTKKQLKKRVAFLLVLLMCVSLGLSNVLYASAADVLQIPEVESEGDEESGDVVETEENVFSYEKFDLQMSQYDIPIDKEDGVLGADIDISFSIKNQGNVSADQIELTGSIAFPEGICLPDEFRIKGDSIEDADGIVYFELQREGDKGIILDSAELKDRILTVKMTVTEDEAAVDTLEGWKLVFYGSAWKLEGDAKKNEDSPYFIKGGEEINVAFDAEIKADDQESIVLSADDSISIYDEAFLENTPIALLEAEGTLAYSSSIDYEYGSGYFRFPASGDAGYGPALSSWKTCTEGAHAGEKYKAITATSKDSDCYVDMYKNGRMTIDGKSIYIDTRMYLWTDSKACIREKEGSRLNVCAWGQVKPNEKSVNKITMEFHFYKAGTLDSSDPQELSVKGVAYFCDMDTEEGYKIVKGEHQIYTHKNAEVQYDEATGYYYGTSTSPQTAADEHSIGVAFTGTPGSPFTIRYNAQVDYSMTVAAGTQSLTYKIVGDIPEGMSEDSLTPSSRRFARWTNTKESSLWQHTDVPGYTFVGWKKSASLSGSNYTGVSAVTEDVTVYGSYTKTPDDPPATFQVIKKIIDKSKYGPEDSSGFTFIIKGTSDEGKHVNVQAMTDSSGVAYFSDVPQGTYTLMEADTDVWWTPPAEKQVTISGEGGSVEMTNIYHVGNVELTKTITDPGERVKNAKGFKFKLEGTSTSGDEVLEYESTDENGVVRFLNIPVGAYTVTEVASPEQDAIAHWWDTRNMTQSVTVRNGETSVLTANNIYKTGNLTVQKSMEEADPDQYNTESELKHNYNNKKSGFAFRLSGISDSGVEVEEFAVTDESGLAEFVNIPIGTSDNYSLVEVSKSVVDEVAGDGNISALSIQSKATQTLAPYVTPQTQKVSITYHDATHSQGTTKIADYHNTLVKWRVSIKKKDYEVDEYQLSQGASTLQGAVYGLYDDGKLIDTYSTDKNGEFTTDYYVLGDEWYIKEMQASKGYLSDPNKYPVKASIHDITSGQEFNDAALDQGSQCGSDNNTVYEHVQKGSIKYYKIEGDTKETDKDWLTGAGFSIYFLPELNDIYDTDFSKMSDEEVIQYFFDHVRTSDSQGYDKMIGMKTATVFAEKTNKDVVNGSLVKKVQWADGTIYESSQMLKNEYLVPELSSDEDGIIRTPGLPYGKYIMVETTVPEGHVAAAPKVITIDKDETDGSVYGDKKSDGFMDLVIWDADVTAYIKITKQDAATGKSVIASGAQYVIHDIDGAYYDWYMEDATTEQKTDYKRRWGDLVVDLSNNNRGSYNKPYTTEVMEDVDGDPVGTFIRTVRELPQGRYVLEELHAPDGYILQGKEGLYRTDKNGNTIYEIEDDLDAKWNSFHQVVTENMNGIWVKNKEKASTDARVMVTINHNTAQYDPEIAAFVYNAYQSNDPAVGKLSVYAEGQKLTGAKQEGTNIFERLMDKLESFLGYITGDIGQEDDLSDYRNYMFEYEYKPIAGSAYVIHAAEDVVVNGVEHFAKGDLVTTITTDKNGQAWTEEILTNAGYTYYGLPVGKYTIAETVAGNGFALSEENQTPKEFEITYDGEEVPIVYRDEVYVNPRQNVNIELTKSDYETGESVSGAVFGLYTRNDITDYDGNTVIEADTLVSIAETTTSGGARFINGYVVDGKISDDNGLPLAEYYAKELKAPKGYVSIDTVIEIDAVYDEGQALSIDFGSKESGDAYCFVNEQTKVQIHLMDYETKEELDDAVLVIVDKETGEEIEKVVTVHGDQAIIRGLEIEKTYLIEEIKPKEGYTNQIYEDEEFTVKDEGGVQMINIYNKCIMANIKIQKRGEVAQTEIEDNELKSIEYEIQGLPGACYDVIAAEDIEHPDGYSADIMKAGTTVAENMKTDEDGIVTVKNLYPGSYKITETKAPTGYSRDKNACSVVVDLWAYYMEEFFEKGEYTEETFTLEQGFLNERQSVDIGNSKIPAHPYDSADPDVDLYNKTGVYKEGADETVTRVEGAEFTLYAKEDILDVRGNISIPAGTKIETAVSGEDGRACFLTDLPVGVYVVKETAHPYGYYSTDAEVMFDAAKYQENDEVQVIRLQGTIQNAVTVTKVFLKDDLTKNELAGASLKVVDEDGREMTAWITENTSGNGYVIKGLNPGNTYQIEEVIPRDGYTNTILVPEKMNGLLSKTAENAVTFHIPDTIIKEDLSNVPDVMEIEIHNAFVTGNIGLTKEGEVLENVTQSMEKRSLAGSMIDWVKSVFGYKEKRMEGVEFTVYAAEEISHPDGITGVLYQKGELVKMHVRSDPSADAVNVTDKNGEAVFAELYLGKYKIKETNIPEGYTKNDEAVDVTLVQKDYTTQVVDAMEGLIAVFNTRQKVDIALTKNDADDAKKRLKGAVFGLYTKKAIVSENGNLLLAKDALIETGVTDSKGIAEWESDLPLGEYYIKELTAPNGYELSAKKVDIDAGYQKDGRETLEFDIIFSNKVSRLPEKDAGDKGTISEVRTSAPQTGTSDYAVMFLLLVILSGAGIGYLGRKIWK